MVPIHARRRLVCLFAVVTALLAVAGPARAEDAMLSGRVVDAGGTPLAGVNVSLYLDDTEAAQRHYRKLRDVMTGDDSAYEFDKLPKGYYLVVPEHAGLARSFRYFVLEDGVQLNHDFVLRKPVPSTIVVKDKQGRPIAGATLRWLEFRDASGEFWLRRKDEWETFAMNVPPSNADGLLRLPELAEGSIFKATIDHEDLCPVICNDVKAGPDVSTEVVMKPGVTVALKIAPGDVGKMISDAEINFRHDPFNHPSSMVYRMLNVNEEGTAYVTVEAGRYRCLQLTNPAFHITPAYMPDITKGEFIHIGDSANEEFLFQLHKKVPVRGRVVDVSGKPMAKVLLWGEVPNVGPDGKVPEGEDEWADAGLSETDEDGRFTLDLAAGMARITPYHDGFVVPNGPMELTVAADGSTIASEIVLRPMPKVAGTVVDADGDPVEGAAVRFRGGLRHMRPTKTDDKGRFELSPTRMPIDDETEEPKPEQPLVAFHPHKRLYSRTMVKLNDPDSLFDITLTLEPELSNEFLNGYREESTLAERGEVDEELLTEKAASSLIGQPAPPLDGTWLNIDEPSEGLAAFRGKYVLLDFWFIGCGPCHGDYPSVQLLHDLYKDQGVVVIAVHNNSATADAVRQFAEKEGMHVPIVVDEPDGTTIARYEGRGLSGYPSHILIGPDGTVIDDDRTTPGPSLRTYKIELIRELLIE